MPADRHYPHAPITEALIDLRVRYSDSISLERLKEFGAGIRDLYPHSGTRDVVEAEFQAEAGARSTRASSSRKTVGYIFHTADKRQAVQARLDGFTFSRFMPYENWANLRSEAYRLWNVFVDVTKPIEVQRVAVRYINQLNLPLPPGGLQFEDYLRTHPVIGPEAGQELEQFFVRLMLPQRDLMAHLVLTEALLPPQNPETVGLILDIDLFRDAIAFDVRSKEIWDILDMFRTRKNLYFEASITDAARELFT